jgi:hypothetical protein
MPTPVLSKLTQTARDVDPAEIADAIRAINGLTRLHNVGHSLGAGSGASDVDRDAVSHLASALGAREYVRSWPAAIAQIHNSVAVTGLPVAGSGGFANVLQTVTPLPRPAGRIAAGGAAAGQKVINLDTTAGMSVGDQIWVGTGDPVAAGRGEMAFIAVVNSGIQITTVDNLVRAHLATEPVFTVPTDYLSRLAFSTCWYGINDVVINGTGEGGTGSTRVGKTSFKNAMRTILAFLRCAEYMDCGHPSCSRTGSWGTLTATNLFAPSNIIAPTANGAVQRIEVPSGHPGGIFLAFWSLAASGNTWTIAVDGVANGQVCETRNAHFAGSYNVQVIFVPLTAGQHYVTATVSNWINGNGGFLGWGIPSRIPPLVLFPNISLPFDYSPWLPAVYSQVSSAVNNGAGYAIGTSSFTIDVPVYTYGGGVSPAFRAGEPVIFERGTGQEEVLTVAADAAGTTLTTTTPSTKTHADNAPVIGNFSQESIKRMNTALDEVRAEFDAAVIPVDLYTLLALNEDPLQGPDTTLLTWDKVHYNDRGYSKIARIFKQALEASPLLTDDYVAALALSTAPLPSPADLVTASIATVPTLLGAEVGAGLNRLKRDLRKAYKVRFQCVVGGTPVAASRIRPQYSPNNGTTWLNLGRPGDWSERAMTATDLLEASGATTGYKDSGWVDIAPPAIQQKDVLLRLIVGNATTGSVTLTKGEVDFAA